MALVSVPYGTRMAVSTYGNPQEIRIRCEQRYPSVWSIPPHPDIPQEYWHRLADSEYVTLMVSSDYNRQMNAEMELNQRKFELEEAQRAVKNLNSLDPFKWETNRFKAGVDPFYVQSDEIDDPLEIEIQNEVNIDLVTKIF